MELQTVNKEIALKLKDLGFDWKVDSYYANLTMFTNDLHKSDYTHNWNDKTTIKISVPTQALICKWLRDVHNIIVLPLYRVIDNKYLKYIKGEMINEKNSFNTYEQAEEAGIIEALKLIK